MGKFVIYVLAAAAIEGMVTRKKVKGKKRKISNYKQQITKRRFLKAIHFTRWAHSVAATRDCVLIELTESLKTPLRIELRAQNRKTQANGYQTRGAAEKNKKNRKKVDNSGGLRKMLPDTFNFSRKDIISG